MFNPMKIWWKKGPFTSLFVAFLKSNIKGASKFTIMAYIGTYCILPVNVQTDYRCDGKYLDLRLGQLFRRRLVRSDS
jgi:hypothetical protein